MVAARSTRELPTGLKDSKKLSKLRRQAFYDQLLEVCQVGEGWVLPSEIDAMGLGKAMYLGVARALKHLAPEPQEEIIIDGNINYAAKLTFAGQKLSSTAVVRADDKYPIVSAASIIAKVKRDQFMAQQAIVHPVYGFDKHVGYGTAAHIKALELHGVSILHRLSYKPIQTFVEMKNS